MNLLISLRSEILKSRRTASFYITLISASLIPVIFILDVSFDGVSEQNGPDVLNAMVKQGFAFLYILIFPMYVILVGTLLPQLEFRNQTWKQVFASPQPMSSLFIARFLNLQVLILVFLLAFNLFMAFTAVVIHFIDPSLDLLNQPLNGPLLLEYNLNAYIGILALSALQFWLGLRFRNFIMPIVIGVAFLFTGSLMVMEFHTANAHYLPYTYLSYSFFPDFKSLLPTVQAFSVGYMVLFLLIGFLDFRRRRLR